MKHCPQCEFTFDDQEQVCDFDGTELSPVPERPPSFKKVSFAPASSGSFVRRLVTPRSGLAVLALGGVLLSALLIGYYDSVNQSNVDKSTSQTRGDRASMVPSNPSDTMGQAEVQADRRTIISTRRTIGADELPPSMVKRLQEGTRSGSAKSRRDPPATKLVATKRKLGPSNSRLVATRRKPKNVTRQSQARNQARPASRERARQQHSVASGTYRRPQSSVASGAYRRPQSSVASGAYRHPQSSAASGAYRRPGWSANESAHHKKDSKVVAILKKTGSILKKPFELIVDR